MSLIDTQPQYDTEGGDINGPQGRAHVKYLPNGKVMKVQKTRQRKILSCIYCHSKKIKCSRVQPICNNCSKLGIECKYFVNERVSRGGKKGAGQPGDATGLRHGSVSSSVDSATSPPLSPESKESTDTPEEERMVSDQSAPIEQIKSELGSNALDNSQFVTIQSDFFHQTITNPPSMTNLVAHMGPKQQVPTLNSISNITNNFFNNSFHPEEPFSLGLSSFVDSGNNGNVQQSNQNINSSNGKIPRQETSGNPVFLSNGGNIASNLFSSFIDNSAKKKRTVPPPPPPPPPPAATTTTAATTPPVANPPRDQSMSVSTNPGLHNSLNAYPSNPETTINYLYGTNTNYNNELLLVELLKHLPRTKERSFELIDRYVNSVHILLPLMSNLDTFLIEHNAFWNRRSKDNHSPDNMSESSSGLSGQSSLGGSYDGDLQFYTLYFPILYASTISEFEEYDNLLLNEDINLYLKAFNKICQYYNYPHGLKTIPLLLGNVIIQSTLPNPSTMEMSQIIRYAKFLHMHKDPTLTLRITDWKVVKFRRMLWWVIFGLDSLTSHNFCLPPVCKFDDFNVLMPLEEEPINDDPRCIDTKLNVGILLLNVKFKYDRILSELVYRLHGLTSDITSEDTELIKGMIVELFEYIHEGMAKIDNYYRVNPPSSMQELNLINFIKNHSWSYVDRALMLLHKKILLGSGGNEDKGAKSHTSSSGTGNDTVKKEQMDSMISRKVHSDLSLSQYEDTFGLVQEANIIANFDRATLSQLKFSQFDDFTYENLHNNLIPSILHNLNDFLKYNDFIKFGKYNWYVKRTIPLDSIILMFIVITVKFKYEFMTASELAIYVKLINKALFILNRKWFKNEKYKRMLLLANLTWEFMLKKYNIINIINQHNTLENSNGRVEFFDYQVSGYLNMNELFNVMEVPQPLLRGKSTKQLQNHMDSRIEKSELSGFFNNSLIPTKLYGMNHVRESELMQMKEKIYYDLRNNFVDINDYCAFYSSLENIIRELMDYINKP